jgi:hypothetical protein
MINAKPVMAKLFGSVGIERLGRSADGSVACPCDGCAQTQGVGLAFRERMLSKYAIVLLNMA